MEDPTSAPRPYLYSRDRNPPPLALFVDRLAARTPLDPQERAALLNLNAQIVQGRANQDVVAPGEQVEHACVVVAGLAGRFELLGDGRRQITALHLPGDMCDLHSVIVPEVAASLHALTATTFLRIPHHELRAAAERHPASARAFWRDCAVDASIMAKWLANIGRREARCRMAHLFCEMALRHERSGQGSRTAFRLEVTQTQLADLLALTPVHVNRTLQKLRGGGFLSTAGRDVQISAWQRLAELAGFEPRYLHIAQDVAA